MRVKNCPHLKIIALLFFHKEIFGNRVSYNCISPCSKGDIKIIIILQQFYFSAQKVYSEKGSKALQMKEVLKILTSVTDDHSELHFVPQSDL